MTSTTNSAGTSPVGPKRCYEKHDENIAPPVRASSRRQNESRKNGPVTQNRIGNIYFLTRKGMCPTLDLKNTKITSKKVPLTRSINVTTIRMSADYFGAD